MAFTNVDVRLSPRCSYHLRISTVELVAEEAAAPSPVSVPSVDAEDDRSPWRARRWPPHALGLIGVVVAFVAIGSLFAFEQPPFLEADEIAHLAYAHEVASFHFPEIDKTVFPTFSASEWRAEWASRRDYRYRGAWVANHPPLNYVIAAPSIWFSNWTDRRDGGLLLLRLQNVLLAAAGVALTYFVALELTRGDRRLALASSAVVALVPQGHTLFSHGLNDGLAFAAATGLVWATLRCLRAPDSRRNLVLLAAFAATACGARAATMLLAVVLVGVVAVRQLLRRELPTGGRARWCAATMVIGLGPAAALFGWFYVRNDLLYGDLGGSKYVLDYFGRRTVGSVPHVLTLGHMWVNMYHRMTSTGPLNWAVPRYANLIAIVALVGLGLALVTHRAGLRRDGVAVAALSVALITVTVAQHIAGGGNAYPRYFFPVLGVLACLVVIGLDRLAPRVAPVVLVLAMAWWLMARLPISVDPSTVMRPRDGLRPTPPALRVLPVGDEARRVVAILMVAGGICAMYGLVTESVRTVRRRQGSNQSPIETPGSRHTSSAPLATIVGSSSGANT